MEFGSMVMGFGFGAVGGAILADTLHLGWMQTPFFFIGGIIGAVICSGAFGEVGDVMDIFS